VARGGSTVSGCTASGNGAEGIFVWGPVYGTTIADCTASGNTTYGILIEQAGGGGHNIVRNVASRNKWPGIQASAGCTISGNTCEGNGLPAGGAPRAGIQANGAGNRIDSNHVMNCDEGIVTLVGGNLVVRNSVSVCTTPYNLAAGTQGAEVLSPTGAFSASDPWANFRY
jgi:parallel beta-helix repeat protein